MVIWLWDRWNFAGWAERLTQKGPNSEKWHKFLTMVYSILSRKPSSCPSWSPFPSLPLTKKFAAAAIFFLGAPTATSSGAGFNCGGGGKAAGDEGPRHGDASATTMISSPPSFSTAAALFFPAAQIYIAIYLSNCFRPLLYLLCSNLY